MLMLSAADQEEHVDVVCSRSGRDAGIQVQSQVLVTLTEVQSQVLVTLMELQKQMFITRRDVQRRVLVTLSAPCLCKHEEYLCTQAHIYHQIVKYTHTLSVTNMTYAVQ